MNIRNGTAALGLLKALVLAVSVATVARAGLAYLPLTGPATLRVLAAKPPKPAETTVIVARPAVVAADNCTNISPETVVVSPAANSAYPLPPLTMGAGSPLDVSAGTSIFMMASPDFLNVTPAMLATYFTPSGLGTNGVTGVVIPTPIFVPPLLQIQRSSTAEYIIK